MCFANINIQYSLTKYGFWSTSQVIQAFSDFHFLSTCGWGTPPPCLTPARTTMTYFFYFVDKNVICQSIFICNIALKIRIFVCFRSHLSIVWFPFSFRLGRGGGGATPPPLPVPSPWPLRASNEGFALVYYNSSPPPSTKSWSAELLHFSLYKAFGQKTIYW